MLTIDGGIALAAGAALAGLTGPAVWILYHRLGGQLSALRLDTYLAGAEVWPAHEHNVASHAVNEALWDSGFPSVVPYAESFSRVEGVG